MLIPIRHENMTARRWPVITLALIVLNTLAFVFTTSKIDSEGVQLGHVKVNILTLAATHPELKLPPEIEPLVTTFRDHNAELWKELKNRPPELAAPSQFRTQLLEDVNP